MIHDPVTSIKKNAYKGLSLILAAFVLLLILTWAALALEIDLKVASIFFSDDQGWKYKDAQPFRALYLYGTLPGLGLTLTALALYFFGFFKTRWHAWQKPMLVVVLTSILGAGLLVNGILKPYCGRPRPREIIPFNGQWDYCSPCFNNTPGKGLSFPCGHCTMGFLFVSLIFLRRQSPAVAYGGTAFGLFYGSLMGVTRAVQGAHFATDTIWSLGVLMMVSLLLHYILIPLLERSRLLARTLSKKQIVIAGVCIAVAMGIITLTFLTRRPFYKKTTYQLGLTPGIHKVVVYPNVAITKSKIGYEDKPAGLTLLGQGFGWHKAREKVNFVSDIEGDTLNVEVRVTQDGYFAESQHQLFLTLPTEYKDHITVKISTDVD